MIREGQPTPAEMEAPGYLTNDNLHQWLNSYGIWLVGTPQKGKGTEFRWSKSTRYYLDGRVKYRRKWIGRWFVCTERERYAYQDEERKSPKGWLIRPDRAYDVVYLTQLRRRIEEHIHSVANPKFDVQQDLIFAALPDGGQVLCDPRTGEDGQTTYYTKIYVDSADSHTWRSHGAFPPYRSMSFGSESDRDWPSEPLQRLAMLKKLNPGLMEVGKRANDLQRWQMRWWGRRGGVHAMVEKAIIRHLPYSYQWGRLPHGHGPTARIRILDTTHYYRFRDGGWECVVSLVEGQESDLLCHDFGWTGDPTRRPGKPVPPTNPVVLTFRDEDTPLETSP